MLTFPKVAEIPYLSSTTEKQEKFPSAVAIMGNPGKIQRSPVKTREADWLSRYRSSTHEYSTHDRGESALANGCKTGKTMFH